MNKAAQTPDQLLQRRSVLGPAYRLFYEQPLRPVRGEDVWLFEADGNRCLDAYNNVPVVGHANARVVKAMAEQAAQLNTHTRYLHASPVEYGERLAALFPSALDTVMFTCTGSEANDLALRIALEATGRCGLIVTNNAYHGVTLALADISPSLRKPGLHVRTIDAPCSLQGTPQQVAEAFAHAVDAAALDLESAGYPVAALIVDTVFASDGVYTEANGALALAAQAIRRHGGLFVADEVQGGLARLGTDWWAFARDGVVPDMVTLGKPMGNGHPIGALIAQSPLLDAFGRNCRYFNTFGGNTVSCAVGMAVLDELERLNARQHVAQIGHLMQAGLEALANKSALLGQVRGRGLYWGVDVCDPDTQRADCAALTQALVNQMRQHGVLIGTAGKEGNVLKIRPPLTFQRQHVDMLMDAFGAQCQTVMARCF